jgi:integrase
MKCELTSRLISTLELPSGKRDEIFWDSKQAGLGLRVRLSPNGSVARTWVARRKRHGKAIKVRLGSASEIGVDMARKAARKILAEIDLGRDPAAERRAAAAKDLGTMSVRVAEYLKDKAREVRPRSLVEATRYLQGRYFKDLHNVPVHEIDRGRVSSCVKAIAREGHGATASEARVALSTFFSWAMRSGYCDQNPVVNAAKAPERKPRDRVLSDRELVAVWNACGDDDHGKITKLLILLGARRQEVGGMAWSEFDDPDHPTLWTLPSARAKNGIEHKLPLPEAAVEIIRSVPKIIGRDQLFGVRLVSGFCAWNKGKKQLDKRLGDSVRPWVLHDLRRSFATKMCEDCKVLPHVVEVILNHQSGHKAGVAGAYNRALYANQVREALLLWEAHIAALISGERVVVPLHQTA